MIAATGALAIWLASASIQPYYLAPFILGTICLPMIALSDLLQGISRANAWAFSALSPTYITRPVLILVLMAILAQTTWMTPASADVPPVESPGYAQR